MSERRSVLFDSLLKHVIGGGWGSAEPDEEATEEVLVLRGADFPDASKRRTSTFPRRYESAKRVQSRVLQAGDIVLEISGGTKERPVGRTVFITQDMITHSDVPIIPASFCRLIRLDTSQVDPAYIYYYLQDWYEQGGSWEYQVQSTGIANFQFEYFRSDFFIEIPTLPEQRAIVEVLQAFDDLIDTNLKVATDLKHLSSLVFDNVVEYEEKPFSEVAKLAVRRAKVSDVAQESKFLGLDCFGTDGQGIQKVDDMSGLTGTQVRFDAGDCLFGKLRPYFQKVDRPNFDGYCSPEIWALKPLHGISGEFLEAVVSSKDFTDHATQGSGGSRMPRADWGHVSEFVVRVPAPESMKRTSAHASKLWESRWKLIEEVQELNSVRETLRPLLLSGEIAPNSAAKLFEGANT